MKNMHTLDKAFTEGFLKKQSEYGFEKEAFLPALLNIGLGIGGSVGGAMLGQHLAKRLAPSLTSAARAARNKRLAARNGGILPAHKDFKNFEADNFMGKGYDKVLQYLSKSRNSMNLADQTGMAAGGILGGTAVTPFMMGEQ